MAWLKNLVLPLAALMMACATPLAHAAAPQTAAQKSTTQKIIRMGAASSPKYGAVFDAMKRDFERAGIAFEFTLYPNYHRLTEALMKREVDIAWNTPMAHARVMLLSKGNAIGLVARDVDIQYAAQIVVRKDSNIDDIKALAGKTVALGSLESAELNALPKYYLKQQGMDLDRQAKILNLDGLVDDQMSPMSTATAVLDAVTSGRADAGAVGEVATRAIKANPASPLKVVWTSPRYTHCIMTALGDYNPELIAKFKQVLLAETMADPIGKEVLVNEGNDKIWMESSSDRDAKEGFTALIAAIKEQNIPLRQPAFDASQPIFRVGAVSSTEALKSVDAMRRYFLRQGEKQFEYYMYGTSEQLSDALQKGKVDIAWTSSLPVAQSLLRDKRILTPVAIDSEVNYNFQVVVRKDSPLESLQALAGKKLVLGSEDMAELSILPRFYLPKAGVDLGKLTTVSLNGAIDPVTRLPLDRDAAVAKAVQDGQGDAGIVGAEYAKTLAANPASPLKAIWTSPSFSREAMLVLPKYKHATRFTRIMQSMHMNDAIAKTLLAAENGTRWVAKQNLDGYRDLVEAIQHERAPATAARPMRVSLR